MNETCWQFKYYCGSCINNNSKSPRSQNELYFRDLFFDDKFLFKCKIHHLSFNPINTHSASIRVISCSYPRNFWDISKFFITTLTSAPLVYRWLPRPRGLWQIQGNLKPKSIYRSLSTTWYILPTTSYKDINSIRSNQLSNCQRSQKIWITQ